MSVIMATTAGLFCHMQIMNYVTDIGNYSALDSVSTVDYDKYDTIYYCNV